MLRKTTLLAGLATFLISTPVQALEHQILVLPDAYFPQTSYVSAGDTLIFINESEEAITVTSVDSQWTTGELVNLETSIIIVAAGMTTDFIHEGYEDENGDPAVRGIISFIDAPLDRNTANTEAEVQGVNDTPIN